MLQQILKGLQKCSKDPLYFFFAIGALLLLIIYQFYPLWILFPFILVFVTGTIVILIKNILFAKE